MKRLTPWKMKKIFKRQKLSGQNISLSKIRDFISDWGFKEYLDADKYCSELNDNAKGLFMQGYKCYTKQKPPEDEDIEHLMIFYTETYMFSAIDHNEYVYVILFFKEKTMDHQNFETSKPVKVICNRGLLSDAKSIIENTYLGNGWTTSGRFDNLDEAINSLEKDINDSEKI